jgi:hypothetical protein
MLLDHQKGSEFSALPASRTDDWPPAADTAQAVIGSWHAIDDALTPLIGARGLVALYLRALHLSAADPAMRSAGEPGRRALVAAATPALLQALIASQSPAHAVVIGNTFLQIFYELMSSLVGAPLTDRLLRAAMTSSPSSTSTQENSHE